MANEVQAVTNELELLNTEIIAQQSVAGKAMYEIGKRLKHVRDNVLVNASWDEYCGSISLTVETADRLIELYEEFSVVKIEQGMEALMCH